MLSETILIIAIGFSPGGATGADVEVLEYNQSSLKVCQSAAKKVIEDGAKIRDFRIKAICVQREKNTKIGVL